MSDNDSSLLWSFLAGVLAASLFACGLAAIRDNETFQEKAALQHEIDGLERYVKRLEQERDDLARMVRQ